MKEIMRYISTTCISFTFSSILYLLLSSWNVFPPFDNENVLIMLFLSIAIVFSIFLVNIFPIENLIILRLAELISVLLVLLLGGFIFNIYPFSSIYIFSVITIGVMTYLIVTVIIFTGEQASARAINSAIQKRKLERLND